jgi:hypothetical protein
MGWATFWAILSQTHLVTLLTRKLCFVKVALSETLFLQSGS